MDQQSIYYRLPGSPHRHEYPYRPGERDDALGRLLDAHPEAEIEEEPAAAAQHNAPGQPGVVRPVAEVFRGPSVPGRAVERELGMLMVECLKANQCDNPMLELLKEARRVGASHVVNAHAQPIMRDGVIAGYLMLGDEVTVRKP